MPLVNFYQCLKCQHQFKDVGFVIPTCPNKIRGERCGGACKKIPAALVASAKYGNIVEEVSDKVPLHFHCNTCGGPLDYKEESMIYFCGICNKAIHVKLHQESGVFLPKFPKSDGSDDDDD